MCIVYHVTLVEASRNVNLGTRYDSRCVGAECGTRNGEGGEIKKFLSCDRSTGSCICLLCVSVIFYRQGHIHDPVLLSQDRNYTFVFSVAFRANRCTSLKENKYKHYVTSVRYELKYVSCTLLDYWMDDILMTHLQSDPELTVINFIGNDLLNL